MPRRNRKKVRKSKMPRPHPIEKEFVSSRLKRELEREK